MGGTDPSWYGRFTWLAYSGPGSGLAQSIAVQSSGNCRTGAAVWIERGGARGANGLAVRSLESPGFFSTATNEVSAQYYVSPVSHFNVHYSDARKQVLKDAIVIDDMKISPIFFLVGHGYEPLVGSGCFEKHCFWYRSHLIPKHHCLPDSKAFVY